MSQPIEPTPGAPADPIAPPVADPTPGAPVEPSPTDPVDVEALPENVKSLIASLRKEAGAARTGAKAKAAEEARADLMKDLAEKLGLTGDNTPADPEALTKQLQQSQADAALVQLEHHTYRTAVNIGGAELAERLLDSISFREKVDAIEGDDFDTQLAELIKAEAAKATATTATTGAPVANLRPGALPAPPAPNLDEQIAEAQKRGDTKAVIRLNGQKMAAAQKK